MYADRSALEIAGQIVIAGFFLFQGVKNVLRWHLNVERMAALGIARPALWLGAGFVVQFAGATLVLFDTFTRAGALLLIAFTVAASAVFHRFWRMEDPVRAEYHFLLLTYNVFVIGALLLIV